MNARCSPERIFAAQPGDQFARLAIDTRATTTRSGLPTPVSPKAFAVPSEHRLRPHDDQCGSPARPDLGEANPEHPVAPGQADPATTKPPPQYCDLVTQRTVLGLQGRPGANRLRKRLRPRRNTGPDPSLKPAVRQ